MAALTLELVVFAIFVKLTAYFLIARFSKAIALFLVLGACLALLLGLTDTNMAWDYLVWNLTVTVAASVITHGILEVGKVGLSSFGGFR